MDQVSDIERLARILAFDAGYVAELWWRKFEPQAARMLIAARQKQMKPE